MRVLIECSFMVPGTSCGVENFVYSLVRAFSVAYPSDRLLLSIPPGSVDRYRAELREVKVEYLVDRSRTFIFGQELSPFARYASALARRLHLKPLAERFDLPRRAWARQCEGAADVVLYPFHKGITVAHRQRPVVVVMHDVRDLEREPCRVADTRRRVVSRANALVTSWPHPYSMLRRCFPDRREDCFAIPFLFEPLPLESELGPVVHRRRLVYAASNGPDKNHENLIRALAELKRRGAKPIEVICPGHQTPSRARTLAALSQHLGVSEWIRFLGFIPREDVRKLYRQSAGVVAPTRFEAFSGAVLEGFSYGKPVACSRIPSLTALIDPLGIKVSYFDPDSPTQMASAIEAIVDSPHEYREGSARARRVLQSITPESTARRYREVLAWACHLGPRPPGCISSLFPDGGMATAPPDRAC